MVGVFCFDALSLIDAGNLWENGSIDLIVVVGSKLESPSVELEIVEDNLLFLLVDASDESVVTCPSVVGGAWNKRHVFEWNIPFGQFRLSLVGLLCNNQQRFAFSHFKGYLTETVNGIGKHRCPIRVLMRPRELHECLPMPFSG